MLFNSFKNRKLIKLMTKVLRIRYTFKFLHSGNNLLHGGYSHGQKTEWAKDSWVKEQKQKQSKVNY